MVLLGKLLKGRSTRAPKDVRGYRIRKIRVQIQEEELKNEEEFHKRKREHLRAAVTEEQQITNFNKKKILTEWRKIMRLAKTDELKREIEVFSQNHEREVDSKDAIMQMLDRDLEEAEEQYQTALRNYMIHNDRLQELQSDRLRGLHEEFTRDLKIMEDEFSRERGQIVSNFRQESKELQNVINAVQEEGRLTQENLKTKHETSIEASKRNEETAEMQKTLEKTTNDLKSELDVNYHTYQQSTKDLQQRYYYLTERDSDTKNKIEGLSRVVEAYKSAISKLKLDAQKSELESNARNSALKTELDTVTKHYHALKDQMLKFREDEVKKLTHLIHNSRSAFSRLKEQEGLGERILKLAELCRKLETEKEKVIPFYQSEGEVFTGKQGKLIDPEVAYEEYSALECFYKRYNKVYLDKLAIEKQKKQLERDNLFFKGLLKQYLDGVSVNEDVMNTPNPLLVVNNRIQLNRPPVERVEKPLIEAAHIAHRIRKIK